MKLSNKYKSSEYIFLFSILVLALFLGTYLSFYAFLWRDIKSDVQGFSKYQMEGMKSNNGYCYYNDNGVCVCSNDIDNNGTSCTP